MLEKVVELIEALNAEGVRYCHWKSNWVLDQTLMGDTDIDLLVHRDDARVFRSILRRLGFAPSIEVDFKPLPSVEHHHALDPPTEDIVHVHAYFRVVTGESLVKNYRLPIEQMLLENTRRIGITNVPTAGAELIVFTLRMLIKHTSIIELLLLARDWKSVEEEAAWLVSEQSLHEAGFLLSRWLPEIDTPSFRSAVRLLTDEASLWRRIAAGYRIRRWLRRYARHGWLSTRIAAGSKFMKLAIRRLTGPKPKLTPLDGGVVIAVAGSDASGKSTTLDQVERWLSPHFTVRRIHAGKPPATLLTFLPHWLLPAMRRALPGQRSTVIEAELTAAASRSDKPVSLLFAVRAVMLAWERRSLLVRAYARAANGEIVLCDRYPSSEDGAPDGKKLGHLAPDGEERSLHGLLARLEGRLYGEIPPPDLVLHLSAPLDVTLARNAGREGAESEVYVRWRHSLSSGMRFDGAAVYSVSTDRPFEESLSEVKQAIWSALYGSPANTRTLIAE